MVREEKILDAVTALSGSGPAFVFLFIEAFADSGVHIGLTREDAYQLAVHTVLGASKVLDESGAHPAVLKNLVTTPAGTTAAGLHELERGGLRAAMAEAIMAARRRAEELAAIPEGVLKEIHECDVTLKGPTTTPEQGDGWPNIESANVAMRKVLDLFANVRPVRVPAEGIDWTFFRENTEDLYAVGSEGFSLGDLNIDFKILSNPGSERIIRAAFEYAKNNGKDSVTVVTKANVVKTTDGAFLDAARRVADDYPDIGWEGWYIDIMTAKLVDPKRRTNFQVFALPNLYGDILTDEAAEFQGGVGTAGAANIGTRTAMFEAIHGSAPRMVREGRDIYADPSSMLRAGAMLLSHIGYQELGDKLDKAMDLCGQYEKELVMTGRNTGATTAEFGDYVLATVRDSQLEQRWSEAIERVRAGA